MGAVTKAVVGVFAGVVLATILIFAVMAIRASSFGGPLDVEQVELPPPPAINAANAVEHLSTAIKFRTVTKISGDPATPEAAKPWRDMHNWMEETYPLVHAQLRKELIAGYTLLYTWQGSDPSLEPIVLMAHQDVVPINMGTIDDWDQPPFSGNIADGYIYGRGTLDNKGSLIAIIEAAEALLREGFEPKRTIILSFGHDEEVSGGGAQAVMKRFKQRGIRPEMVLDEGFYVIRNNPLTSKTLGFIGVSEKGYMSLKLVSRAAGGHSSMPPRNSANVQLSKAILALENNQLAADFQASPLKELIEVAAPDMPFMQRLAFANMWAMGGAVESALEASGAGNAMIRTTTAPTMLSGSIKDNVLPQRAEAVVNFRIHPNDTPESVRAHVEALIADIDGVSVAQYEGSIGSSASPVSSTETRAFAVLHAVADKIGEGAPVAPGLVIGATDARYATGVSDNVYRFAPASVDIADTAGFHGTNERLEVKNVQRMVEGYAQIMMVMGAE